MLTLFFDTCQDKRSMKRVADEVKNLADLEGESVFDEGVGR